MKHCISIIVPIYNVETYLRNCLNSLLEQTFQDLEIILVDDGSPDNCGVVCDEYARKDTRVKVIHKPNGGRSDARNAGLDAATGDYIGFVDPDDWVEPDMYEYLYRGMQTYQADIVICGYYVAGAKSIVAARRHGDRIFRGAEALEGLLTLKFGNYAWNKLYRRELFDGIRYPVGQNYEDVRTTYRLVQKCNLVVALPEPKYYYRQNEDGIVMDPGIQNKASCAESRMSRYSIIAPQNPNVQSFLPREIFQYCEQLCQSILHAPKKEYCLCEESLQEILKFLQLHHDEIAEQVPLRSIPLRELALMCRGCRASWQVCGIIVSLRNLKYKLRKTKLFRWIKKLNDHRSTDKLRRAYYSYLKLPLNEKGILLESRGASDFAGNILYLAKELQKYPVEIYLSVWKNDTDKAERLIKSAGLRDIRLVYKRTLPYYKAFATCKYLFNDMVYEDIIVKREGQIWTNTWHGTPLKCLEYDVRNQRHELGGAAREFLRTDYFAVPSKFMLDRLIDSAKVRNLLHSSKALYSGYPRNQVFFDAVGRNAIRRTQGIDQKEVFVYMPTWRGTFYNAGQTEGIYSIANILSFFENHLTDRQCIYVKLHNLDKGNVDFKGFTKVFPFPDSIEPYAFLNAADCLITDYSSVFFDFANTGKKIVLFTYDREDYLHSRGVYINLDALPFPKANTYEDLLSELNTHKNYDDSAFRKEYCSFDCADAAEKIVRTVLRGEDCCSWAVIPSNGKRNVLHYDTGFRSRPYVQEPAIKAIADFTDEHVNHYYGIKQRAVPSCPAFLMNLPNTVGIFSLAYAPGYTALEKLLVYLHIVPQSLVKREINREMYGMPFDEIRWIDSNKKDAFRRILDAMVKSKGDWRI